MEKLIRSEDNVELLRKLGSLLTIVEPEQMRKSAASNALSREMLLGHKPDKDHFLMHVIALGDGETYGPNRNADFFPKEANQKYHPTFVKHGHFFREHNNKDPELKIGDVKASIYNDEMSRVELAVWGHKKKASDVYEKLKAGENVSDSMSCFVPYDVDNCTAKKARTPAEYELHMKTRPNQYIPEFQKYAYVINPQPKFFDISYVAKPADRIAHYLDYFLGDDDTTEMAKAASASGIIPGAYLAKAAGITTPEALICRGINSPDKLSTLEKLAALETMYHDSFKPGNNSDLATFVKEAAQWAFEPDLELKDEEISKLQSLQPGTLFSELAKRAAVLPYYSFLSYATDTPIDELKKSASCTLGKCYLPSVFKDMLGSQAIDDEDLFDGHGEGFMSSLDSSNTDEVQKLLDSVEQKYSVAHGPAKSRSIRISIQFSKSTPKKEEVEAKKEEEKKESEKKASEQDLHQARTYAHLYGLYKIAAVTQMSSTLKYALDNQALMRVISQNNL